MAIYVVTPIVLCQTVSTSMAQNAAVMLRIVNNAMRNGRRIRVLRDFYGKFAMAPHHEFIK
jgi:hypothetical protein